MHSKRTFLLKLSRLALAGGTLAVLLAAESRAVPVAFTIDPTRSSYHIVNVSSDPSPSAPLADSTILSVPVIPQVAVADTDALSGTISADETAGVLSFSGTSAGVSLAANAAGPLAAPAANPGTDNFGIMTKAQRRLE